MTYSLWAPDNCIYLRFREILKEISFADGLLSSITFNRYHFTHTAFGEAYKVFKYCFNA